MTNDEMIILITRLEDLKEEQQVRIHRSKSKDMASYYENLDFISTYTTEELLYYCPPELMSDSQIMLVIEQLNKMLF